MNTHTLYRSLLISLILAFCGLSACIESPNDEPEAMSCEMNGQQYETGETFSEDNGCNSCSCTDSGEVVCTQRACASCEHEGTLYSEGESYSPDDCNTCTCSSDGSFSCTRASCEVTCGGAQVGERVESSHECEDCFCMENGEVQCESRPCGAPEPCQYRGETYDHGESFPAGDGCNTCSCESGQALCSAMPCVSGCEFGGVVYPVGESFPSDDGCNECFCDESGGVSCTELACEPPTCMTSEDCGEGLYCTFARQDCGEAEGSEGVCVQRPDCLPVDEGHFCGCDGSYADNVCTLAQRGEDLQPIGACNVPTGADFVCGDQTCAVGQACNIAWNDIAGPDEPLFYASCVEVTCDAVDPCDCLMSDTEGIFSCEQRGGHTFIFYQGG